MGRGTRSPKKKGYKGKKINTPPKYKRGKSIFMSPKEKYKRVILPSTLEYKDTTKKFSNVHTYESFIGTRYIIVYMFLYTSILPPP